MESNNFEKEVSQKLGEFKVSPEEEVWSRIEKEIAPKRGTRKGVLLFLLLLIISSGAGWWLMHQNNASKSPSTFQNMVKRENENDTKGITSLEDQNNEKTIQDNVLQSAKKEPSVSSSKAERVAINPTKRISKKINQSFSAKSTRSFIANPSNRFVTKPAENVSPDYESHDDVLYEIGDPGDLITVPWFEDPLTLKNLHFETLNPSKKVTLTLKKQSIKKHKWATGVTISGGSSWIENKAPLTAPAYYNTGSYVTNSYGPGYFYYPSGPSTFTNSFSFIVGVFAERNLSQKIILSLGISYSHLSVQNKVRNNFEFVQLPVLFHLKVNRNDHLPITFDAGITAAKLAGSDAQQYNYSTNRWYHDNNLFNQFQANFHTGFSFTVFNKHDKQMRVGPAFSYDFTQMAGEGIYAGEHLHVLSFHAEVLFGKK